MIGGAKLRRNFRPGPENSFELARWALWPPPGAAIATAMNASTSHTPNHARDVLCR